jgi:protocatechuate 3,4-dioxygenase beta subunit
METSKLTRRQALAGAGSAGAAVLIGFNISRNHGSAVLSLGGEEAFAAGACTMQTPAKEIGPFFVDEKLNRGNLIDNASDSAQQGVPLALTMYVFDDDNDCALLVGAQVDVWHANATGVYSDESSESTVGKTWMRGYQLADADGKVSFQTVWPGWYSGRTCHVHLRVRTAASGGVAAMDFITRLFFPEDQTQLVAATSPYTSNPNPRVTNDADRVYSSDGASVLVTLTGDTSGYGAQFSG